MNSTTVKDSRWFAWYDAAKSWNAVWHLEAMVHGFAFFLEGKNPWSIAPQIAENGEASETYSSRIFAWNVSRQHLDLNLQIFRIVRFVFSDLANFN